MTDICTQHDLLLGQLLELGNQISHLKSSLIRVVIAACSTSSAVISLVLAVVI